MIRGATALIVAAGSGQRFGAGRPKALVELAGRPLFEWSLDACRKAGSTGPVIIAAPATELARFGRDGVEVVAGGATRSESVARGLELVESELVMVHDAARPLVTPDLIDECVSALEGSPGFDAMIAAAPATDTIKQVDGQGTVTATLDRSRLRMVQTPQVFRTASLRRAMASGEPENATDDASLIEAAGGSVGTVEAPSGNIKVTVPDDLEFAALMLAHRERA
ncbi:MAG: 2-C-methyl-D-erythritol 4-phosphate cytidylyltransferase [Solirubrobacterales bacterium]|nr:2-C-methyl-D-erythritol 4-phosphate cytidylyltransferase [Solirubrobacterales bacterium]